MVLTPDRANNVYRHRFTAAHELGHLLLHPDTAPGDLIQEKEADAFAAELLTPSKVITPQLPARMDLHALDRLSKQWGVAVDSPVYRCREVGAIWPGSLADRRAAGRRLGQGDEMPSGGAGEWPSEAEGVDRHLPGRAGSGRWN